MISKARWILTALLLALGQATTQAEEPNRFDGVPGRALARQDVAPNQKLADTIAEQLRQSGQLRHYNIQIFVRDGTAELDGNVTDQTQREEALRLVQGVPGIERVRDRLVLKGNVQQTQGQEPAPAPLRSAPDPAAAPIPNGGAYREPVPVYAGVPGRYDFVEPKMPPYAWPTYAPYNNYSRVANPQYYPYESWPYIGPCYPFPKVPLSWRKVKLEWQDGFWWYGKCSSSHDWWRLRYW